MPISMAIIFITDEDLVILISNCVRRLTNTMLHAAAASDDGIADNDGMYPISSSFSSSSSSSSSSCHQRINE